MSGEMVCTIVGQLSDVIHKLDDSLHELRNMRQLLEERLPKTQKPTVQRMPWYTSEPPYEPGDDDAAS